MVMPSPCKRQIVGSIPTRGSNNYGEVDSMECQAVLKTVAGLNRMQDRNLSSPPIYKFSCLQSINFLIK